MKKISVIIAIACMAFAAPVYAEQEEGVQVDFQVSIKDPTSQDKGTHKIPQRILPIPIPLVFIDGNTLYFDTPCDGCLLQLVDETGFVAYVVTIPAGITEWELPYAFQGEYKLKIIRGKYCFSGWIEL